MKAPSLSEVTTGMFSEVYNNGEDIRLAAFFLNIVRGWASIIAFPVEAIAIRPFFCTRYFHIVTAVLGWLLLSGLALVGTFLQPAMNEAQHTHGAPIGTFWFLIAFYFVWACQGPRLWRRIQHMELESESHEEGPALPIFRVLPFSESWVVVRVVYEPALVLLIALLLYYVGIIEALLAIYLLVVAIALTVKNMIRFWDLWNTLRDIFDGQTRSRAMQAFIAGHHSPESTRGSILARLAPTVPQALRQDLARRLGTLSPEIEALLSPPVIRTPAARSSEAPAATQ